MERASVKVAERVQVLISLGSNIAPERNVPAAMRALEHHPQIDVIKASRAYETEPVGESAGQAYFHNAAALVETMLGPAELRTELRGIEAALGRVRTEDKFAPRTIDLDITFYGNLSIALDGTRIPDPDVALHLYLVRPLAEVAPEWVEPTSGLTLRQVTLKLASLS